MLLKPFTSSKIVVVRDGVVFYVFYAFAIGSPSGMQTEQRGRTDAVPVPRYKLTRAVILTVLPYCRWVATPLPPKGCWLLPPSRGRVVAAYAGREWTRTHARHVRLCLIYVRCLSEPALSIRDSGQLATDIDQGCPEYSQTVVCCFRHDYRGTDHDERSAQE